MSNLTVLEQGKNIYIHNNMKINTKYTNLYSPLILYTYNMKDKYISKEYANNIVYTLIHNKFERKTK